MSRERILHGRSVDRGSKVDDRAIEPLIEAMKTDWYSVRFAAAAVLKKVTGQSFGVDFDH